MMTMSQITVTIITMMTTINNDDVHDGDVRVVNDADDPDNDGDDDDSDHRHYDQ